MFSIIFKELRKRYKGSEYMVLSIGIILALMPIVAEVPHIGSIFSIIGYLLIGLYFVMEYENIKENKKSEKQEIENTESNENAD